jgi:hypothetical protein
LNVRQLGHNRQEAAQRARELLATMTETLVAARQDLVTEQQLQGSGIRKRSS